MAKELIEFLCQQYEGFPLWPFFAVCKLRWSKIIKSNAKDDKMAHKYMPNIIKLRFMVQFVKEEKEDIRQIIFLCCGVWWTENENVTEDNEKILVLHT